jgi:hypothetical protein
MTFFNQLPSNLQKIFSLFPKNEKESLGDYLFRLKKYIHSLKNDHEMKKYLKLYSFLNTMSGEKEQGGKKMNIALLESELVPKNGNLYKSKRKRNNASPIVVEKSFVPLNPLENAQSFVKFYRRILRAASPNVKFAEGAFESECRFATAILDDLIQSNRDEKFIKMWIYNYLNNSLKGENVEKPEKTSVYAFSKTFETFNMNYLG